MNGIASNVVIGKNTAFTFLKEMAMNELNKKLAEWAGLTHIQTWQFSDSFHIEFRASDGMIYFPLAFTESLDACFKWLVPKLAHYFIGDSVHGHTAAVWNQGYSYGAKGDTPALALCLAIEKLIDGDKRWNTHCNS